MGIILRNMGDVKLAFRVNLYGESNVSITLLQIHRLYMKNIISKKNSFYTNSSWMFFTGLGFMINPKTKSIILPVKVTDDKSDMTSGFKFGSDEIRYNFLKDLKRGLLEWANDKYFQTLEGNFDEESDIKFKDDIWLIY